MIEFTRFQSQEKPNDTQMDKGEYVWRDWWPATDRQELVAHAAYFYLCEKEPYAAIVFINGIEYNRTARMWRINYSLQFPALPELVLDVLFLSPSIVNEILVENDR